MIKKILIAAAIVIGIGFFLLGPAVFSHVGHVVDRARASVEESIPLEYELQRAEGMVEDILPEIEACKRVVAEEQVEIKDLERDIAQRTERQERYARRIQARNEMLKTRRVDYKLAGRSYSRAELERELRLALSKYKQHAALIESKRRLLDARRRSMQAARQRLSKVMGEKENLLTRVEHLRARLREVQAMEAAGERFALDASGLAEAKKVLNRCRKRLDVAQKMLENEEGVILDLEDVAQDLPPVDICKEIDRYFAGGEDAGGAGKTLTPLVEGRIPRNH